MTAAKKRSSSTRKMLERADRLVTLGEVAAEIAHEVNNPAGIILTRAEILKDELDERGVNGQCIHDLDIIAQQTKKIARHYPQYSAPNGRKLPKSFAPTDLNDVIHHAIKVLQPRISKCNVNVVLKPWTDPAMIWGNFNQLEQVFCNLINNSLDVVPSVQGRIEIEIRQIEGKAHQHSFQVVYQDNGPGIPIDSEEKVFSPFYTTKEDGKGTGLGLFIARNIVGNHQGNLILEKNDTGGACFVVEVEEHHE